MKKEDALLIVTGRQDAVIYRVKNGSMERLLAFKVPTPRYSDKEGFTKAQGRGVTIGSGWPRELKDEDILNEFIKEFKDRLKSISPDFEKLFLLTPSEHKNTVRGALPKDFKKKLKKELHGNYFSAKPQDIIVMLEVEV